MWTFKNTGSTKILKGVKFVMVAGDEELNMPGMQLQDNVPINGFFKLRIKTKAPMVNKHYSAGYMLLDGEGNYFGDKVVLDVIVEDDCSESVILAEMMDNVDMSMRHDDRRDEPDFKGFNPRDERTSMLIHRPMAGKGAMPPIGAPG